MRALITGMRKFYPDYLRAHTNRYNRILHFAGATLFFLLIIAAFITKIYWLIAIAVFAGYLLPGIGHRFFEHNKSFRSSRPVYCVWGAFRLYGETWLKLLGNSKFKSQNSKEGKQ
ncbi:DUF962 domain-containing protein [Nostoc ellipsosporum NOK]|nr:DUF962 domain-containing protein [Nostoc ellipsosporum NOK]